MTYQSQFMHVLRLALLSFAPLVMGNPSTSNVMNHYHLASELDVTSKSCDYDTRKGFAGDIGDDYFTVDYFYTMNVNNTMLGNTEIAYNEPINFETLPDNSLHNVVFQVELEIASYLLRQSGEFRQAPCNNARRLMIARNTQEVRNVGMTVGPDDQIVAACETGSDDPEQSCYWVEGYFQVYTVGTEGNTSASEQAILMELKDAMDSGELSGAHPALLGLSYQESLPSNTADGATSGGTNEGNSDGDTISASSDGGPDAAIIVGASVGAVLLIAAIALVARRRKKGYDDQSEFQPSSMDVSEFHMSKEESEVGDASTMA